MPPRTLTTQELNRTHLQRQHLLQRADMSVGDMLSALAGLQAQEVKDPYLALWSRLQGFQHHDLGAMLEDRSAVRASLMRGTIHLVTAADYLAFFPATYQLHRRAVHSVSSARLVPRQHHAAIAAQARALLEEQPLTAAHIGESLKQSWPEYDARSLSQVVRFLLPLVQVPPRGVWGPRISSRPAWTMPHNWLGTVVPEDVGPPHELLRRYLRAFGPASLPDMNAWSGLTGLKAAITDLADELVTYRDQAGVTLYDLAGVEIADPDMAAPVRFLPGFDNALLGHKDRSRIISKEHQVLTSTQNGMFASTFLVDGFVAGMWRVREGHIELVAFAPLASRDQDEVEAAAARVAPFWTGQSLSSRWVEAWKQPGKW